MTPPTELGQAWYYSSPTTLVRYGGPAPPPPPTAWDPTQVVSQPRPSGTGYVTYESLFVSGDTLSDVAYKVPLLSGVPQYLTLPAGVFEVVAFNQGNYDGLRLGSGGAVGCRGIFGSGNGPTDTIIRPKANSATRIQPSNIPSPAGKAGTVIRVEGVSGAKFGNFRMEGTVQTFGGLDLMYTGLMMGSCPDSEVSWVKGFGMSHGNKNAPDGETFGVNVYKSDRTVIRDCDIDSRLPDGVTRWGASPFGWNGGGILKPQATGAPVTDAQVLRTRCMYSVAGMPTWWQTFNIYTEDLWSVGCGSGSGGLSGHGMNHEQSWGHIEHHRTVLKPKATQGREPDKTGNTGTHLTLLNDSYDPAADFTMIDPVWDTNFGTTGMLIVAGYDGYSVPPGGDGTNNYTATPTITKNGVQLLNGPIQHPAAGWADQDPTKYFARIH